MTQTNNSYTYFYVLLGIFVLIVIIIIISVLYQFFNEFYLELRYLNTEIKRTKGAEQRYWIRRRRKLWFSLIPFIKY